MRGKAIGGIFTRCFDMRGRGKEIFTTLAVSSFSGTKRVQSGQVTIEKQNWVESRPLQWLCLKGGGEALHDKSGLMVEQ